MSSVKKKITIAKGIKVKRGTEEKMRSKEGSSSAGKYKTVKAKDFAGAAGGADKYSFPINTKARARNALARAHFAPDPEGIRRKVEKEYPSLEKAKGKTMKKCNLGHMHKKEKELKHEMREEKMEKKMEKKKHKKGK